MKKILVFMIFIMTSLTMYFLVWWQPTEKNNQVINTSNVIETDNNMKDNTNVEKELDDSKKEQDKIEKDLKKEEAKKIEEESKKAEEERANKLEEEKENNKLIVKKINENMSIEDKKNVDKLLNGLSTIDLMKIEEGILSGDLNSVKALISERLLLEESKLFFEIIGRYK